MKPRWQIFWHIFFWLAIISICLFIVRSNTKLGTEDMLVIFLLYPAINIGLFYINYLLLIPWFLDKKRYGLYALSVVAAIVLFGVGKYGVALIFKQFVLMHGKHELDFSSYFWGAAITSLLFLFLSTVLKFTVDWFLNERIQRDLENQRLSAELAFFKIADQSAFFV